MPNRKYGYKDLKKWRKTTQSQKKKYYQKTQDAPNRNERYTDYECEMILKHEISDTELSKMIGHSVQAIQSKRNKLNKKGGMTY